MNLRLAQTIAVATLSLLEAPAQALPNSTAVGKQNAEAAPDPAQSARQYMDEGAALYSSGDWSGAHVAFLKAWEIKKHRAIAANLAEVEIRLGLYVQAAERLKFLMSTIPGDHADEVAGLAAQMSVCRQNSTSVRIAANVADARVRVNGEDRGTVSEAGDILLEPGEATVEVSHPEYRVERRQLTLERGKALTLELRLEPNPTRVVDKRVIATAAPVAPPPERDTGVSTRSVVLIAGSTLTIAAGAMGVLFWRKSVATYNQADGLRSELGDDSGACLPGKELEPTQCRTLHDRLVQGDRERNTMTGAVIAGGVLGVATAATYFLWPKAVHSNAIVTPWSTVGGGGMQLATTF